MSAIDANESDHAIGPFDRRTREGGNATLTAKRNLPCRKINSSCRPGGRDDRAAEVAALERVEVPVAEGTVALSGSAHQPGIHMSDTHE